MDDTKEQSLRELAGNLRAYYSEELSGIARMAASQMDDPVTLEFAGGRVRIVTGTYYPSIDVIDDGGE